MNTRKPYPLALMAEFGISWLTVIGIIAWALAARKKDGSNGVRKVGMICGLGGIAVGGLSGFTSHLATCAGMGFLLLALSYTYPALFQMTNAKTKKE